MSCETKIIVRFLLTWSKNITHTGKKIEKKKEKNGVSAHLYIYIENKT